MVEKSVLAFFRSFSAAEELLSFAVRCQCWHFFILSPLLKSFRLSPYAVSVGIFSFFLRR